MTSAILGTQLCHMTVDDVLFLNNARLGDFWIVSITVSLELTIPQSDSLKSV